MIEDPPEYRGDPVTVLRAGSRVAGYRLDRKVGTGGMAVVYRARDERLGRPVALKILTPVMAADATIRQRFIQESQAAAAVNDPHIIPVYEAGEADGVFFIAMRFVNGGNAGSLLRRQGPLPPARVASIISPVASALDAAHAAGLVHRDVKPENMLLDTHPGRPDQVYLSDFGISKGVRSGRLTGSGQAMGTPEYMAPEQIEGLPLDGRTDQYALACTAFELLTGEALFDNSEGWAAAWAHVTQPPPTLTSRRPDLPPGADQVFARALAKVPQDRYATCWQFADALREALGLPPDQLGSGAAAATLSTTRHDPHQQAAGGRQGRRRAGTVMGSGIVSRIKRDKLFLAAVVTAMTALVLAILLVAVTLGATTPASAARAISLNGSTAYVQTSIAYTDPTTFSLVGWFKTTAGGTIIGFADQAGRLVNDWDRVVWVDNRGQVVFGVFPDNKFEEVVSRAAYNDGKWHFVVAELGSSGMMIYVDGIKVAANPSIRTAQVYTGYWHLGWDNEVNSFPPWPNEPTDGFFSGSLTEMAVVPGQLTSRQVAALYADTTTRGYFSVMKALSPIAYWPLQQTSGRSVPDSSGHGDTGTAVGGVRAGSVGPVSLSG